MRFCVVHSVGSAHYTNRVCEYVNVCSLHSSACVASSPFPLPRWPSFTHTNNTLTGTVFCTQKEECGWTLTSFRSCPCANGTCRCPSRLWDLWPHAKRRCFRVPCTMCRQSSFVSLCDHPFHSNLLMFFHHILLAAHPMLLHNEPTLVDCALRPDARHSLLLFSLIDLICWLTPVTHTLSSVHIDVL